MTHAEVAEVLYRRALASLSGETAEDLAAARTWAESEATKRMKRRPSMEWLAGPHLGLEVE